MNKMIKLTDLDNRPIYLRKDTITAVFESKEYNTNDLQRINDEADSYETYEKKFEMLSFRLCRIVKVGIDGYKVKESIQDILDAIESN